MKFSFATFIFLIYSPAATTSAPLDETLPGLNLVLDNEVITIPNKQISYATWQDNSVDRYMATISDDGTSFSMSGNMWRALELPLRLTPHALGDFVVSFDFDLDVGGEVHGICFDENLIFGDADKPSNIEPRRCLSTAYLQKKQKVLDVILTNHQTRVGESHRYVLNLSKIFDRLNYSNGNATYAPTMAPTDPIISLQNLGWNPVANYPLGQCQGDCDTDKHCAGDMKCLQRSGREEVPGCLGKDSTSTDYCYGRLSDAHLWQVGNNGSPAKGFPLGECEGDCDNDKECGEGLYCFHRSALQPVPGCVGNGLSNWDYCVDPHKPDIKYLAFINDNDADKSVGNSTFRNIGITTELSSCLSNERFRFTLSECTAANFLDKVQELMAGKRTCNSRDPLLELFAIFDATQETDVYDKIQEICTEAYKTSSYDFADTSLDNNEGTERQIVKESIDGGTVWNYEDDATSAVNILRANEKYARSRLLSYPEHHALDNCDVRAAMCCFVASRNSDDPRSSNSDVCYVDMKTSHRTAHVRDGYSIYGDSTEDVYCEGFAWESDGGSMSSALKGNALFKVGFLENLVLSGTVEQVPGAPLCGCIDRMPVVTEASCTDVTDANGVVDVSFDSSTGEFDAFFSLGNIGYGDCGGKNLVEHYESLVTDGKASPADAAYLRERIVGDGNCDGAISDFLSEKGLVMA